MSLIDHFVMKERTVTHRTVGQKVDLVLVVGRDRVVTHRKCDYCGRKEEPKTVVCLGCGAPY